MNFSNLVKFYAFRMFEQDLSVRCVAKVFDGDVGYYTLTKWRKEWGQLQRDRSDEPNAA